MAAFKTHVFQPAEPVPSAWELFAWGNLPVNAPGSTKEKIYTEHFKKDLKHKSLWWWNKHWTNKGFQTVSDKALEDVCTKKVGKKFEYKPWLRTKCTLALLEKKNFFTKARDKLNSLNQNNTVGKTLSQFREFFGDVRQNREHIVAFIKFFHAAKQTDIEIKMPAHKINMPDIKRMPLGSGEDDDAKQLLKDFKTWMFQSTGDFSQAEGKFLPSEPSAGHRPFLQGVKVAAAVGLNGYVLFDDFKHRGIVSSIMSVVTHVLLEIINWKPILLGMVGFITLFIAGSWILAQSDNIEDEAQRQREAAGAKQLVTSFRLQQNTSDYNLQQKLFTQVHILI